MQVKDILEQLAAHPDGSFLDLVDFNDHGFGACSIEGVSPVWEMHPDTDEFFYVIEGQFELTLLRDEGEEHIVIPAGSVGVVPRGLWHRPAAPQGAKFMYLTPGTSLHSDSDDPRKESPA